MPAEKGNHRSQRKSMVVKKQKTSGKKQFTTAIKKGPTRQEVETQEKLKRVVIQLKQLTKEEIQRATHR